jgi:ABC-type polysaccharide/polyol phosphate transport system ATPase subunit
MNNDIAISVKNVSKTFRIPHEKVSSLRGAAVNAFKGNKGFEEFKALDDVSFEVKKGEFFGIIGRNGSGKSTLLKILAGIYQTDKGSIKIDGRISPFLELGIGFNPELSGRDNVYLNATVLGMSKKEIDKKFDSIVAFSELERFIDQKLKNYSSGMQVRLAFSVSIHANREILLMDEVLAVGDSNFQQKCLNTFKKFKKDGKTIILVTHDMGTVLNFCDRAILLNSGKNIAYGKTDSVMQEYSLVNISNLEEIEEKEKETQNESCQIFKEKEKTEKRWGTGEANVLDVELFQQDAKGELREKNILISGKLLIFRVNFKNIDKIEDPVLGLGIHLNENDQYCFALNTYLDKVKITSEQIRRGFIEIEIPSLALNNGDYYINVIIGDKFLNFNNPIDFVSKIKTFTVKNRTQKEGLFNIKHNWK